MGSQFRREGESSNSVIGIILLILLLVFVSPNVLPAMLSRTLPFIDEGIPCARLREGRDRAYHQSLIGRLAQNPLSMRVEASAVPTSPDGVLSIDIIISNNTIGTIPIIFDELQVIVGDNPNSSGIGLIFRPPVNLVLGNRTNQGATSFPESTIRLLGPRQRCVHQIDIPYARLDSTILSGQATVSAFYRITNAGITQQTNPQRQPIYPTQGLDIIQGGYIESEAVPLRLVASAN